jgi:hypothetical protein
MGAAGLAIPTWPPAVPVITNMRKTEAAFQTRIKHSFDLYCSESGEKGVYHKISDSAIGRKPFDCFFILNRRFIALELKVNRLKTRFNFTDMFKGRLHQARALSKIQSLGHKAWTVIKWGQEAYAVDGLQTEWLLSCGSVDADVFTKNAVRLPRMRNEFRNELVYDLTPIL